MTDKTKLFKRSDIVLIGLILVLALSVYVWQQFNKKSTALFAEISLDGVTVKTVDLSQNAEFSLNERPAVVFEVRNNSIAFIKSDCPDKVCINSGFLNHPGQLAACLPNLISISISGETDNSLDEPDIITY